MKSKAPIATAETIPMIVIISEVLPVTGIATVLVGLGVGAFVLCAAGGVLVAAAWAVGTAVAVGEGGAWVIG